MNQDVKEARKVGVRRLAASGLTEREIAAETGISQSTVHRDLEGWEPPASEPTEAEIQAVIDEDPKQYGPASARLLIFQRRGEKAPPRNAPDPDALLAEANRLYELQVAERGIVTVRVDGKPVTRPGPYVATPEREHRATEILRLRKEAARLRYPTRRVEA